MIAATIGKASAGQNLSMDEMSAVVEAIMTGQVEAGQIGVFLIALREKGETAEEIAGAARTMRRHMTPIRTKHDLLIDTCGTGGDGSGTFNISTAAALVTAAAGVPVAKHGNRAITSKSGSADVLAQLGVNIDADEGRVGKCLDELGIGFCFAPRLHPSMKSVAAVRKELGVPTVFNMLGPLTNPASAPFQLIGVGKPHLRPLLAKALAVLGTRRTVVVHGEDGLDEVTLFGKTLCTESTGEGVRDFEWSPQDFDLPESNLDCLQVASAIESAEVIRNVLSGAAGPARDIVILNSAAALWTAGTADSERACALRAQEAIDTGAARRLLEKLARMSHA